MSTPERDAAPKHDPYAAFRHNAFRLYVGSYVLAVISSAMLSFSAKFEVNELKRAARRTAAFYLGLLGATGAIPVIGLSLLAGHVVDRFDRKRVLLLTQLILIFTPALFATLAHLHLLSVWIVYGLVLCNGSALTFARPARSALISTLVPRKDFASAVTWNSTFFETSAIVGPALAGFTIAGRGLPLALGISSLCMGLCLLLSLALPDPPTSDAPREKLNFASLLAGFHFVIKTRLMFATMSLDLFAVLFGGATYLLPMFADKLAVGPVGLSWMVAAPGVGAITMALGQAYLPPFRRAGRAMLWAVICFGLGTIVFGLSQSFYLSVATLVLMGAADNVSVIVRHSLVQLLTPDSMRGRVSAVNQVFIGSSNEIGGFESGLAARVLGSIERSVIFGGFAVLGVVGIIAATFPEVRKLGPLRSVAAEPSRSDPNAADTTQGTTPLQSTT